MPTGVFGAGFRALAALALVGVPATALAHTVMTTPPARDVGSAGSDAHKTGPCGAVPRTNKCTPYEAGATIDVKWTETVAHDGCFQVALSQAGDQGFTILKQIQDPVGSPITMHTDTVTLPAGVTCKDCTLVVRQLMIGKLCTTAPLQNDLDASTYYSCGDIRIGFPDAACVLPAQPDAGVPDGAPGDDSGPHTVPTDGGGKLVDAGGDPGSTTPHDLHSGDGGGCSMALGATSGLSFGITAGLLALALVRRRRRRG